MAKTKLLLIVEVDEDRLPGGNIYTEMPDHLAGIIGDASPPGSLYLDGMYMLNPAIDVDTKISPLVLNYHHYAVNVRGETCEEETCEQHPVKNVIRFDDHPRRNQNPPGIN